MPSPSPGAAAAAANPNPLQRGQRLGLHDLATAAAAAAEPVEPHPRSAPPSARSHPPAGSTGGASTGAIDRGSSGVAPGPFLFGSRMHTRMHARMHARTHARKNVTTLYASGKNRTVNDGLRKRQPPWWHSNKTPWWLLLFTDRSSSMPMPWVAVLAMRDVARARPWPCRTYRTNETAYMGREMRSKGMEWLIPAWSGVHHRVVCRCRVGC